jgi:hypothetical protein
MIRYLESLATRSDFGRNAWWERWGKIKGGAVVASSWPP